MMCWDGEQVDGWGPIHHLSTNQCFLSNFISIYYTNIHYVARNRFCHILKAIDGGSLTSGNLDKFVGLSGVILMKSR